MKLKIGISLLFVWLSVIVHAGLKVSKISKLPEKLKESSGLVYYKGKYLISHNDGGNKNLIYILDLNGNIKKTIKVDEAKNVDWEDLTMDDKGKLYIGDFGNNLNSRKNNKIYILKKDFEKDENQQVNAKKITFSYEDQRKFPPSQKKMNFDAEAFFWKDDSLYILTKCRTKPFTGISNIYVLPDKPGKYKARKIGTLNLCSVHWQWCSVTSADYDPKSKTLAVLVYSKLYLIKGFPGNEFWKGKISTYSLPGIKQREAITFKDSKSWYMTDEYKRGIGGGNLYEVTLK